MTGMLASVRSLEEASIVFKAGVDIIDLKAPEHGALGAVSHDVASSVVDAYKSKVQISATIGDLPLNTQLIEQSINKMVLTGVDIVKIGVFGRHLLDELLSLFRQYTENGTKLVLVFFADQINELNGILDSIDSNTVYGVMLDTAGKDSGSLLRHKTFDELEGFIEQAKEKHLFTGLAGSLKLSDIAGLLDIKADYLGFRGALCRQSQRTDSLDELSVYRVRSKIPSCGLSLDKEQLKLT